MADKLPPVVEIYVTDAIRTLHLDPLGQQLKDICDHCPGRTPTRELDASAPCYSCPLWSLRLDVTALRLRRRLDDGALSDKA